MMIILYKGESGDPGFPPEKAEFLLHWLRTHIDGCPIQLRNTMQVKFTAREDTVECLVFYQETWQPTSVAMKAANFSPAQLVTGVA